jgi:hypothetical protein
MSTKQRELATPTGGAFVFPVPRENDGEDGV